MRTLTTTLAAIGYNNADFGTDFTTCLGRIVWGHPLKPQHKTKDDQKVLDDSGNPIDVWSFGVAFPKADFQRSVWPYLAAETAKGYPNGAPPTFTYKYKDGDTDVDAKGNPLSGKDGYAGCYILSFSTELQAPASFVMRDGTYYQIDATQIKSGDYVMVKATAKWHGPNPNARGSRPGLYINPLEVLLMYEGDAIGGGGYTADPTSSFGAAASQVTMPAGARAVGAPAAGAPGGMPGAPGGMPGAPGGMPGAPGGMPGAAPASPAGPQRPTEPTHIHDNGNGTEQWFINGAWDGGSHPVPSAAPPLPAPATGFVDQAAGGMPGAGAAPAAGGMPAMPGAPAPR